MRHTVFVRDTLPYLPKYPEGTVIDLNRADTASLKRVPGIGSGLARRSTPFSSATPCPIYPNIRKEPLST